MTRLLAVCLHAAACLGNATWLWLLPFGTLR